MYLVQVGFYAWLGADGRLTYSTRHAAQYPGNFPAEVAAQRLRSEPALRAQATAHMRQRERDHYATATVSVVPLADVVERMRGMHGTVGEGLPALNSPADPAPVSGGGAPAARAQRGSGVTRQVYQWCLDHPQATRADALAAFPAANPSTVGVQYGAARKASAQ